MASQQPGEPWGASTEVAYDAVSLPPGRRVGEGYLNAITDLGGSWLPAYQRLSRESHTHKVEDARHKSSRT